jgi:citrate synthase
MELASCAARRLTEKLYPNIDFYSGITLKAMGSPPPCSGICRCAHITDRWKEMIEDPKQKIGRPRQLYTGATRRDYAPISRRK